MNKRSAVPRRWWGRNAGLRPRLVLIVGIAMLAPGALAVFVSISTYSTNMRALEQSLAQAAQLAANEEVSMISASREILTSLAAHPDVRVGRGTLCRRALQRAIAGLEQYDAAAVMNREGVITCTSRPIPEVLSMADRRWFQLTVAGDPFVVSEVGANPWPQPWGMWTAVPIIDERGEVQGAVALFIGLEWLSRRYQRGVPSSDTAFALLTEEGGVITADPSEPAAGGLPREEVVTTHLHSRTQTFMDRGRDGTWRLYAISPLLGGRMFVILGVPLLTAIGPLAAQMAWGVFAPLLMWGLAVAVVWFGIEHLVVRWIAYLERITSAYAAGRHAVRPERVVAAPAEIRSLGETFGRMADLISAREAELRESLAQKEVLVREIHHRVKNNLQLVMSLLNLHARRIRDPRAELAFAEARNRINALATLHRRLYESENLQEIDLRWFLEDLCAELRRSGLAGSRHIELRVEAPSDVIGPEVAVPLGLLVTEAITNAYKHAFVGQQRGHIEVKVERDSPDTLTVTVRDDGAGFEAGTDGETVGLGRSLIDAFVRQLRGELQIYAEGGTVVRLRFPVPARSEARLAAS